MFNLFDEPNIELPPFPPATPEWGKPQPGLDKLVNEIKAQTIRDAIAYLKTTPAVTLVGKGGAYELLDKYAEQFLTDPNESKNGQ